MTNEHPSPVIGQFYGIVSRSVEVNMYRLFADFLFNYITQCRQSKFVHTFLNIKSNIEKCVNSWISTNNMSQNNCLFKQHFICQALSEIRNAVFRIVTAFHKSIIYTVYMRFPIFFTILFHKKKNAFMYSLEDIS